MILRDGLVIFKYALPPDTSEVSMPIGAQVLCVQVQNDVPCLWVLVDPKAGLVKRRFFTFGTGHAMPHTTYPGAHYIGTYQLLGGQFVGHVFDPGLPA